MKQSLPRYLIVLTLSQLLTLGVAAIYPYLFNLSTMSPNLISLTRSLLDYIPAVFLTLFLAYDMARQRHIDVFGLLVTLFGHFSGLLMHLSRQPLVRRFGLLLISYTILQIVLLVFAPYWLTYLNIMYYAVTFLLVLHSLIHLRPSLPKPVAWLIPLLGFFSIAQPSVAMLAVFVLSLARSDDSYKPLYTYLIPIAAFLLLKFVIVRLPLHFLILSIPANYFISTALSLVLCLLVVVLLYRDAPRAGLPRFWLCASVIFSAPLSAMACLMCLYHKETLENNNTSISS